MLRGEKAFSYEYDPSSSLYQKIVTHVNNGSGLDSEKFHLSISDFLDNANFEYLESSQSRLFQKNDGEIVKTENWGLLNLSYLIKKNKKGSYIHFKIKGKGNVIDELEKNEAIDKKLLRYLTVKVKKFDLETNYFGKKEDSEKKESSKN